MAGNLGFPSPMGVAGSGGSSMNFGVGSPGFGAPYDTSTEMGWLQTYYPNHPDLQPGGKYGSSMNFGVGSPGFGAPYDTSTEMGWLQTYFPGHTDLQPGGKYNRAELADGSGSSYGSVGQGRAELADGFGSSYGSVAQGLGYGGSAPAPPGPINFNNIVGMGVLPRPVESANNPNTVGGPPYDISTEKGWLQTYYPNHPDLQPGGKYGTPAGDTDMNFGLADISGGLLAGGAPAGTTDMNFGLPDITGGGILSNSNMNFGLPDITGGPPRYDTSTEKGWLQTYAPDAPDLQPGGKYAANLEYAAGVSPTPGYTIQPGTAAATLGGGMTAQDAAAQAQTYNDLQSRLASEAAFYERQQAALPSSPQNYYSQIVQPYERNFGGQIAGYNPFTTQYQAY